MELGSSHELIAFACEEGVNPTTIKGMGTPCYDLATVFDHQGVSTLLEGRLRFNVAWNTVVRLWTSRGPCPSLLATNLASDIDNHTMLTTCFERVCPVKRGR
jgi:hypothetical protein